MEINIQKNKDLFISILKDKVKREGINKMVDWLQTTDFFSAPASTRYHLNQEGGLCAHSLMVYTRLVAAVENETSLSGLYTDESIAICGLLHDLCKTQFYKQDTRNVKNSETGQWEKVPYFTIEDAFPLGHGEKSTYLIERFMRLTPQETIAIRWHMGGFDTSVKGGCSSIGDAYNRYPIAVMLNIADMQATYLDEVERTN